MNHTPPQTYQSLANEYRNLVGKSKEQHGEELKKTVARLTEIEQQLRAADAAIPRCTGGSTNYKSTKIDWIDATKETPTDWGKENHWGNGEGRHKVMLQDGRELYSWWKDGQWSVERLKPHLKVAFWVRPKIIA